MRVVKERPINIIAIDADSLIYNAGFAVQSGDREPDEVGPGEAINCFINIQNTLFNFVSKSIGKDVSTLIKKKQVKWVLSGPSEDNFRKKLYPEYKANREGRVRPYHYNTLRDYVINEMPDCTVSKNCEADDVLSDIANELGPELLLLHEDKDLDQIMNCWHGWYEAPKVITRKLKNGEERQYQMGDCNRKLYYIEEPGNIWLERSKSGALEVRSTGTYKWAYQMLKGDSADNIKGVQKGFGPLEIYHYLTNVILTDNPEYALRSKVIDKFKEIHAGPGAFESHYMKQYALVSLGSDKLNNCEKTKTKT